MNKIVLLMGVIVFVCDQITKILVLRFVAEESIALFPFFNIVLIWNRGVSFGLFNQGGTIGTLVLILISLAIVGALVLWLTKTQEDTLKIAISCIIAGALGNITDRIRHGAVVDFLDFHGFGWHYPAFNIADSAIVLGIAFVIFDSIFLEAKRKRTTPHA